MRLRKIKYYDF